MLTPAATLQALQGIWFPTRMAVEGQLTAVNEPAFPPPRDVAVMTVLGNTFHVTAAGEYYWTGGRLWIDPAIRRLTYIYPPLPPEWDTVCGYELEGDELRVCSGGFPWSGLHDWPCSTEYRRVAAEPPSDIRALIDSIMAGWCWTAHERATPRTFRGGLLMAVVLGKPPVWMIAELRQRTGQPLHECRRMLEAATVAEYKRISGDSGVRYPVDPTEDDPTEDDPTMAAVLLRATLEVEAELAGEDHTEMGFCHLQWRCKQRVLWERYGVAWSRPDQLSSIVFD